MPATTPPVPGTRFTMDWLNDLATCGDVPADKVIKGLAKRRSTTDVERQNEFPELTRRIWADVDVLETPIRDFVMAGNEVAPHIETDKVTHAQAFFEEHGVAVITALFYAALPEAYLGRRGVQVLDLTGELVRNWSRRIQETGQFLLNVLTPAPWLDDTITSLSPGEAGAHAVRRVRLTHAAVRWLLDAEPTTTFALLKLKDLATTSVWAARMVDVGEEKEIKQKHVVTSRPLNQQDLLATLGTFTTVTFDALAGLGVSFDDDDRGRVPPPVGRRRLAPRHRRRGIGGRARRARPARCGWRTASCRSASTRWTPCTAGSAMSCRTPPARGAASPRRSWRSSPCPCPDPWRGCRPSSCAT